MAHDLFEVKVERWESPVDVLPPRISVRCQGPESLRQSPCAAGPSIGRLHPSPASPLRTIQTTRSLPPARARPRAQPSYRLAPALPRRPRRLRIPCSRDRLTAERLIPKISFLYQYRFLKARYRFVSVLKCVTVRVSILGGVSKR